MKLENKSKYGLGMYVYVHTLCVCTEHFCFHPKSD